MSSTNTGLPLTTSNEVLSNNWTTTDNSKNHSNNNGPRSNETIQNNIEGQETSEILSQNNENGQDLNLNLNNQINSLENSLNNLGLNLTPNQNSNQSNQAEMIAPQLQNVNTILAAESSSGQTASAAGHQQNNNNTTNINNLMQNSIISESGKSESNMFGVSDSLRFSTITNAVNGQFGVSNTNFNSTINDNLGTGIGSLSNNNSNYNTIDWASNSNLRSSISYVQQSSLGLKDGSMDKGQNNHNNNNSSMFTSQRGLGLDSSFSSANLGALTFPKHGSDLSLGNLGRNDSISNNNNIRSGQSTLGHNNYNNYANENNRREPTQNDQIIDQLNSQNNSQSTQMSQLSQHHNQPTTTRYSRDNEWLKIEVCRDYIRGICKRDEDKCRFGHPPLYDNLNTNNENVVGENGETNIIPRPRAFENGKVVCCFDNLKNKCRRENCKYFHPPAHLKAIIELNGKKALLNEARERHHSGFTNFFTPNNFEQSDNNNEARNGLNSNSRGYHNESYHNNNNKNIYNNRDHHSNRGYGGGYHNNSRGYERNNGHWNSYRSERESYRVFLSRLWPFF